MINRQKFFDLYREQFGKLDQPQVDGLNELLLLMDAEPLPHLTWRAYFLATVKHECADKWKPIGEYGQRSYFDKYEPGTRLGKTLGNTLRGDGYLYRGRGYVQLTGRGNYRKLGSLLDIPLENTPDLAFEPLHAYHIAALGMVKGLFTGKSLGDYTDYQNMRRVINGVDKAREISDDAIYFEQILRGCEETLVVPATSILPEDEDILKELDHIAEHIRLLKQRLQK